MEVSNFSILTGKLNTMDLPVTLEELNRFLKGELVQKVFPHLSDEQREFLLNGITPEESEEYGLDNEE